MRAIFLSAIAFLLLADHGRATDWPTHRADAARSGYTPNPLPERLGLLWTYRAKHTPQPAWSVDARLGFDRAYLPVVAGGTLFFGSSADGKVYALDAATGESRWVFFCDAPVRFAPAVWRDRVFVGGDDGWLYCLAAAEGKLLWKVRGGPRDDRLLGNDRMISRWPVRAGPAVVEGVVYFGAGIWPSEGFFLHALDAQTGAVLWRNASAGDMVMDQPHPGARAKSGVVGQGTIVVDGDALIVPTGRAVPAVFDRKSGRFRYFHLRANSPYGGCDAVAAGGHFFNSGLRFATSDGLGGQRLGQRVAVHPELILHVTGNKLAALDRRNLLVDKPLVDRKGKPIAAKSLRQPVWTIGLSQDPVAELICAGDKVVLGGTNQVSAVTIGGAGSPPRKAWTVAVDGVACGLAAVDGRLYVSTDRGVIHCFSDAGKATSSPAGPKQTLGERQAGQSSLDKEDPLYAEAAEEILRDAGVREGYCLDFACGDGRLALALANRSKLQIYAVEADPVKVNAARQMLDAAGLYGVRVTVHQADLGSVPYPNSFADLIVSGRSVSEGGGSVHREALWRVQRPGGGVTVLGSPGKMVVSRREELPGAGHWTHLYANAANTLCSSDTSLRGPLGMLWFRQTDFPMPNRHGRGPSPLVWQHRMFVEGLNGLRAVNIYNGRTLWEIPLPGILAPYHQEHLMGVAGTGSNFCLGDGRLYVARGDRCLALDPASGARLLELKAPPAPDGKRPVWGYLAFEDGTLFGSLANTGHLVKYRFGKSDMRQLFTESGLLFALDPQTGKTRWMFSPEHSVRHNAVAIGKRRVYLVDRPVAPADDIRLDEAQLKAKRRGQTEQPGKAESRQLAEHPLGRLVALDANTGKPLWETGQEVFGTVLVLSEEHDVLLVGYQPTRFSLPSERGGRMAAFRAGDGKPLWNIKAEYASRPILNGRAIYAQPGAWDLLTGRPLPFRFTRSYGCGIPSGSTNLLLFRSATLGYLDLAGSRETENYGGIRPGCWVNAIPAGGLVLMADAASGCRCSYLNQATIALQPLPPSAPAGGMPGVE